MRQSHLSWIFPLLMMTGACANDPTGAFERPYFTRGGLLALSSDYYVVRALPGDTYMGLAWEHNVSPYEVISINQVKAPYRLRPGDLVRIPTPRIHVVRRDETLSGVADAYHVDFYDLAQANALNSPYTIYPGQVLRLPSTGLSFKRSRKLPIHASDRLPFRDEIYVEPPPAGEPEAQLFVPELPSRPAESEQDLESPPPEQPPVPFSVPKPRPRPAELEQAFATSSPEQAAVPRSVPRPRPRPTGLKQSVVLPRPKPNFLAALADARPDGTVEVKQTMKADESGAKLIWPVEGHVISGFGPTENGRHNDGINISVPESTPVRAAADGVVIYCGNEVGGFGNLILIQHADDLVTAYAHASEIKVKKGERVDKGQPIALSGSTGNVEEPQLHFEVRRGVKAVDPIEHLRA